MELVNELWMIIFENLSLLQIFRLRLINKQLNNLIKNQYSSSSIALDFDNGKILMGTREISTRIKTLLHEWNNICPGVNIHLCPEHHQPERILDSAIDHLDQKLESEFNKCFKCFKPNVFSERVSEFIILDKGKFIYQNWNEDYIGVFVKHNQYTIMKVLFGLRKSLKESAKNNLCQCENE